METEATSGDVTTKVTVYTKPDCPDCFNAKRYLSNRSVKYDTHDITHQEVVDELLDRLGPGSYATPIVFVDDHVFFGFASNKEHLEAVLADLGL